MPVVTNEVTAWIVFLALSIPYVLWAKHPASKPVAAYLIFITIVSAVGWIGYFALSLLLVQFVDPGSQNYQALQLTVFGISLVVGILVAHWQIRKPPRVSPPI